MRQVIVSVCALFVTLGASADRVYLDTLDVSLATSGDQMDWARAKRRGKTFAAADVEPKTNANVFGEALAIGTNRFARGVGVLGNSLIVVDVGAQALWFDAAVGADAVTRETWRWGGDSYFQVWADDRLAFDSHDFSGPDALHRLHVDVRGARRVYLQAFYSETHEYTPIDWCDAFFTMRPGAPKPRTVPVPKAEQLGILTPPERPEPRINGPALFGVRPGSPILQTLPVTGERPMTFAVAGLPAGVTLDAQKGFLRGCVMQPGTYALRVTATNAKGSATRTTAA